MLSARCTGWYGLGWAGDLYLAGEGQKCPSPQAFGHYKDRGLTQVCRLLRPIMLRDKLCHLLKTHCSGKKMKLTLVMADYNLIFISECPIQGGKGTQRAECFPVPWGPQLWLQNLLTYSTAGTTGTTTAGQQVPHPPSLSLQVKQLKIPSLNPTRWREGLCRGGILSLLWAGGFSIVFLQETFTLAI